VKTRSQKKQVKICENINSRKEGNQLIGLTWLTNTPYNKLFERIQIKFLVETFFCQTLFVL
jgi:hypothetical protein